MPTSPSQETKSKEEGKRRQKGPDPGPKKEGQSANATAQANLITRLKSYVFKCGVYKVWKRELDGLSDQQAIARLRQILRDLGVEGRPSLEKCREIKARREYEAEIRETVDPRNMLASRLRSRSTASPRMAGATHSPESDTATSSAEEQETARKVRPRLDLAAFGDAEE